MSLPMTGLQHCTMPTSLMVMRLRLWARATMFQGTRNGTRSIGSCHRSCLTRCSRRSGRTDHGRSTRTIATTNTLVGAPYLCQNEAFTLFSPKEQCSLHTCRQVHVQLRRCYVVHGIKCHGVGAGFAGQGAKTSWAHNPKYTLYVPHISLLSLRTLACVMCTWRSGTRHTACGRTCGRSRNTAILLQCCNRLSCMQDKRVQAVRDI